MAELSKEDIVIANKVADRIKNLRIQYSGEKQSDFNKKFGIDKQYLPRWEGHVKIDSKTNKTKGRGVSIYTIHDFCNLIGISLKEFFDDPIFSEKRSYE